ncbi:MAG TPA: phosphoribosylformylglycinamidine synthase subunit PurL [Actinomycetes bacterium]|jgi:phosphoribosylformylglycinamidine synthase|nr:phosphoribosylformylglycinamidine synthase subunit PurL [Actinomycetes bacterium]
MSSVAEALHRQLGLTDEEHERILAVLGRVPTHAELAMYSVMWSEHCSYKSSKVHLRGLPTDGPRVLQGPGENAGVVDVGDGLAAVFKIESHNHPSFVEPFQGAATGVGGIIRDILAMGARPLASLDSLRFGDLADPLARRLLEGVVAGIGHYGNCVGVATVGGEVAFDPCYAGNPLVNALTVGVVAAGRLLTGRAARPGDLAVLMGAKTGRDGIGGASVLASAAFEEQASAKRPSVQVGDPFQEKLLIEACLELVEAGLLRGLQDLGAAGIACATSEVAARSGMGMRVDLDAVPLREPSMEAWEVLVSESQERMLALVDPARLGEVLAVCGRWGVLAGVLGTMVEGGQLHVAFRGDQVADVPARSLADEGPVYRRPLRPPAPPAADAAVPLDADPAAAVLVLAADPTCASKRWVWEQYDRFVGHGTVQGPERAADAAVVRLPGSRRALALATDGNGRFAALDPAAGAALAVAEAARNVACAGATPVAVTNCLNFASPERPEVMGAFAAAVEGLGAACRALGLPVTGGNVSFYNESAGRPVHPTPVVGVLGLLEDAAAAVPAGFPRAGLEVWLLGETRAELGGSAWQRIAGLPLEGRPPALDLGAEAALQRLLVELAGRRLLASAHDLADGGLAVALVEATLAGGVGASVELPAGLPPVAALASETPSRVLLGADPAAAAELAAAAAAAGVPATRLGGTGGERLVVPGLLDLPLERLRAAYEGTLPRALGDHP